MIARLIMALVGCALCAGCAYRVGPTSTLNIRSIAVPNFKNETYEPRISVQVTNAVIKRFQTDGSMKVVSEEAADATLKGTIVRWQRSALRYSRQNVLVPSEYQLSIHASAVLTDNRTGKRLVEGGFVGTTFYFFGDDLAQAERQALSLAADDLARRLTDRIVDAW
ncbi:MAG: LptE family protein [Verrucomicrobia bacterium]|nr:LptE family protein [Verrucomicrobiota bacterium]